MKTLISDFLFTMSHKKDTRLIWDKVSLEADTILNKKVFSK